MEQPPSRNKTGIILGALLALVSLWAGWMLISGPPKSDTGKAKKGITDVKVTLQPTGAGGLVVSRFITCPGDKRCAGVSKLTLKDFQTPGGKTCSSQYGGPSLAWVTGTINGRAVQYQLKVTNGCEIAIWNRLAPVLGLPKSGTSSGIS